MSSWTEGYVADIPYALGFYRETTPAHIAFTSLALGNHLGPTLKPRRVLELGIGMGLGFIINSASNPATEFEGVDFNPIHIAHANGLVDAAQLENVVLREASFQDLAREASEGQHDLDLIVLHGILTWISEDSQEAIVEIARKRLKPGGMLYVSYNCMPGWAPILPMQRLMRENAKRVAGRSDVQTSSGLDLVQALMAEEAAYFAANPNLKVRLERMLKMDRNYLAHEYLNANWFIFYFADVAEMFERAKLGFVGSANLVENIDSLAVPESIRSRVSAETDPIFKETLRDIASNKQFRRDLFARGVSTTTPQEQRNSLAASRFVLAVPRSKVSFKIMGPLGELNGNAEIYGAIADCLAEGPASLSKISALPAFGSGGNMGLAVQAISLYVHSGQVLPMPADANLDPEPAQRLNRVIVEKIAQGRNYNFIAAPFAGSGVQVTNIDLLLLGGVLDGIVEIQPLSQDLLSRMKALNISWLSDGKATTDLVASQARASEEAELFLSEKVPLWRQLGVL